MRFDFLQSVSLAGDADTPNDDRVGCSDALAWVIDGATDLGEPGLLGTRGGAAWLAMEANTALAAAAADASIATVCTNMFAHLARRYDAARAREPIAAWELPSGTFLIVRADDQGVECGWLGDCAGLLKRGDNVVRIGAVPSKHDEGAWAAQFAGQGLGEKRRPSVILDSLRESRMRPDRYLLGIDPAAADHVAYALIACAPGDEVLLMTDGFAALFDVYAAMTPEALMAAIGVDGLAGLGKRLRDIEAADAACSIYPRFKQSDDATAIWLRVAA